MALGMMAGSGKRPALPSPCIVDQGHSRIRYTIKYAASFAETESNPREHPCWSTKLMPH